jgi:UDP-glucose 4-epimerase
VPIDEEDAKLPINPYGASKLMTERMLEDSSAAYGFNYGALRYFNVAGADPQGRSGQIGKGSTHLIKIAVEAAVGKRDHVAVFGTDYPTPDGTCIRDYVHVTDLAAAHVAALERLLANPQENLVLNCGYGRGLSVLEVLDAVDRANGAPVRRELGPRRAGDPPQLVAGNRRLRETLDWRPAHADIDTIVADALAWERKLAEPVS